MYITQRREEEETLSISRRRALYRLARDPSLPSASGQIAEVSLCLSIFPFYIYVRTRRISSGPRLVVGPSVVFSRAVNMWESLFASDLSPRRLQLCVDQESGLSFVFQTPSYPSASAWAPAVAKSTFPSPPPRRSVGVCIQNGSDGAAVVREASVDYFKT